jgi:release factor glutamine methyltransferase
VTPDVLIARPETELLVEWALDWLSRTPISRPVILDIGTGSGAIALSLASQQASDWRGRIIASDVSAAALAVARQNRDRLATEQGRPTGLNRVHFVRGSLTAWFGGPAHLVLANLPYLREDQLTDEPSIAVEPSLALRGGNDDGLGLIRALIADLPRVLAPQGAVALEIDPSQAETIAELLQRVLPSASVTTHADLAGRARFVTAERPRRLPIVPDREFGG